MIKLMSHVGVCVADIDASTRFYCDVLGFTERSRGDLAPDVAPIMEFDEVKGKNCFLERDGVTIELLQFMTPTVTGALDRRPMNRYGFTHMACHVERIDDLLKPIQEAGGTILAATRRQIVRDGFDRAIEIMYATDPNGVRIELIQFPQPAPAPPSPADDVVSVLRLYGTLLDSGRFDEWLDLFTADAVCTAGSATFDGIDQISMWIRQKSTFGLHAIGRPDLHFTNDQTEVTALTSFAHVMGGNGTPGRLERTGRYITRLRNSDGRWRIVQHIIDFDVRV